MERGVNLLAPLFSLKYHRQMKYRYLCLYLILASTFALTSCKDKKKDVKTLEQDYVQQPQMILNSNDSNEVRDAVNYYLTAEP